MTLKIYSKIQHINQPLALDQGKVKHLIANPIYSGFKLAHDTYNALSAGSDGKIYYILSSESIDQGGKMYRYDPLDDRTELLGDLTAICGEAGLKAIPQGKSHVPFFETENKLYFGTHVGFYEMVRGMERLPESPPPGYALYPGGHFIVYHIRNKVFEDLGKLPDGEGILTMEMDRQRKQLYALSWPTGNFIHLDLESGNMKSLGSVYNKGEAGAPGKDFQVICRSMVLDPGTGTVYFTNGEGKIFFYNPIDGSDIRLLEGIDLRLDYFGVYDPTHPGSMAYNWRKIFWYASENVAYGVHGNSGYLFRFDPRNKTLELMERITSLPSKKSGMFDQFSYGYLGFELGPDNETVYYLTGGPVIEEGKKAGPSIEISKGAAKGLENLHLVTYHIPSKKYLDHGPVFYPDGNIPTYVNSIAVAQEGTIYTLARFQNGNKVIQDLVKITAPFELTLL